MNNAFALDHPSWFLFSLPDAGDSATRAGRKRIWQSHKRSLAACGISLPQGAKRSFTDGPHGERCAIMCRRMTGMNASFAKCRGDIAELFLYTMSSICGTARI